MTTKKIITKKNYQFMHFFKFNNSFFLFDISTSTSFEIDEITYNIINKNAIDDELLALYPSCEIDKVIHEMNELIEKNFFNEKNITFTNASNFCIKSIELNLIHACNLKCKYCYGNGGYYKTKNKVMTFDVAKRAIDILIKESNNEKKISVIFFGGEPLLNFELIKQITVYGIEEAKKKNKDINFSMTTNGTLINEDIIDFLNLYKIDILISMDGCKEKQDYLRPLRTNKSSYDTISHNIDLISKKRNINTVRATITNKNLDIQENIKAFKALGFKQCIMVPVETDSVEIKLKSDDYMKLCYQYEELTKKILLNINSSNIEHIELSIFSQIIKKLYFALQSIYPCGSARTMLCVSPDGKFYSCHRFVDNNDFNIGDVYNGLNKLEQSKLVKPYIYNDIDCKNCWIKYLCSGGCLHSRLDSYTNTLSDNSKDANNCNYVRRLFELSIVLYNEIMKDPELYRFLGIREKGENFA